jgi:hypothetical protein
MLVIGDWSNKGRLKFISTPGLSLRRKLKERFEVNLINEMNTSKIHYKTKQVCEKLSVKDLFAKEYKNKSGDKELKMHFSRELHSVLTSKMSTGRLGCINRDRNAVNNFKIITKALIDTKERPEIYSTKIKKESQPLYHGKVAECDLAT